MNGNICANNGERVSNNDKVLSQDLSSSHVEIFAVEDHGDHSFLEDSIEIISSNIFSENKSLNVMRDCENNSSLYENSEKGPI